MLLSLGSIGSFSIRTHDAFIFLGVAVALAMVRRDARARREPAHELSWVVAAGLLVGAVGARLGTVLPYLERTPDPSLLEFLLTGGRSILGGLAGAYVGVVIVRRLIRYSRPTGDIFAPGVALGMAIGRVGCLLTEQLGTPTTLPWGVTLPPHLAARVPNCAACRTGEAMHMSFAYEIALLLLLFILLQRWRSRPSVGGIRLREGDRFKLFLLLYATGRFAIEFVRGNPDRWHGLSGSQLFLMPSAALLVAYFLRAALRARLHPFPTSAGPAPS